MTTIFPNDPKIIIGANSKHFKIISHNGFTVHIVFGNGYLDKSSPVFEAGKLKPICLKLKLLLIYLFIGGSFCSDRSFNPDSDLHQRIRYEFYSKFHFKLSKIDRDCRSLLQGTSRGYFR